MSLARGLYAFLCWFGPGIFGGLLAQFLPEGGKDKPPPPFNLLIPVHSGDRTLGSFSARHAIQKYYDENPRGPLVIQITMNNPHRELPNSLAADIAQRMNGAAALIEHRGFGETWTHWLNYKGKQAAQNLHERIGNRTARVFPEKMIVVGKGYSGFLAAALRQRFPHRFDAALAIEAPTRGLSFSWSHADPDQYLYKDAISRLFKRRSEFGAKNIRKSFDLIEDRIKQGDTKDLQKGLFLCTEPTARNNTAISTLQDLYSEIFVNAAAVGSESANYLSPDTIDSLIAQATKQEITTRQELLSELGLKHLRHLQRKVSGDLSQLLEIVKSKGKCIDWEKHISRGNEKHATVMTENHYRPLAYIACTYFSLCVLNSRGDGLFPSRTNACAKLRLSCRDTFEGKAVATPQAEIWKQYKLSPQDLSNSSRIFFSVDTSDPMTALVAADPPSGGGLCSSSVRREFNIASHQGFTREQALRASRAAQAQKLMEWMGCPQENATGRL
ncbi:hypothetical protein XA68_12634 [Ophiocordyceps unilateralis]|uniref:Peptidase S33 tripeptidyl aminopeptidase-like C-terminal domain-containing protein n=1 Tax=Ophiocordyceps unilateralis TaxID=268505 RepID=A0A2A9PCI8_OPHUN|nr:hypothetical protein XA68_12634 [Ophiocordyceps unilateralis]